jgi:UDP-N-acetylmuramoylalanine-D-glutamate ligase
MLNFSPDHLDRHPTVEAYGAAKAGSSRTRTPRFAVINADDPAVLELARRGRAAARLFARSGAVDRGTVVEDGWIVDRYSDVPQRLIPLSGNSPARAAPRARRDGRRDGGAIAERRRRR